MVEHSTAHNVAVESEMAHESLSALTAVIQEGIDRTLAARGGLPSETIAEMRRQHSVSIPRQFGQSLRPEDIDFYNAAREWLPKLLDMVASLSAGEPDGMEATSEERADLRRYLMDEGAPVGCLEMRMLDDFDRQSAEITRLGRELEEVRKLGNLSNAMWREAEQDVVALTEPLQYGDMLCFTRGTFDRMVEEKAELEKLANEASAREAKAREEERARLLRDVQAMREQYAPLEDGEAVMLDTLQDHVERRARSKP